MPSFHPEKNLGRSFFNVWYVEVKDFLQNTFFFSLNECSIIECQDFFLLFDQVVRNFAIATPNYECTIQILALLENQRRSKRVSPN